MSKIAQAKHPSTVGTIIAPSPERTVGFAGHRGGVAVLDTRPGSKCADLHRAGFVGSITLAKRTILVPAPAPDGAVGFTGQTMGPPRSHTGPGGQRTNLDWTRSGGGRAVTKLAIGIESPRPKSAARHDPGNRHHFSSEAKHIYRLFENLLAIRHGDHPAPGRATVSGKEREHVNATSRECGSGTARPLSAAKPSLNPSATIGEN